MPRHCKSNQLATLFHSHQESSLQSSLENLKRKKSLYMTASWTPTTGDLKIGLMTIDAT
jgi:hypothetical protein